MIATWDDDESDDDEWGFKGGLGYAPGKRPSSEPYNDRVCQKCKVGRLHWVGENVGNFVLYNDRDERHVCPSISPNCFDIVSPDE